MPKVKTKPDTPETETPAMMRAIMEMNPALSSAWMDVMNESTRFVMDRLQQDMETQKALLGCKTPAELVEVQTNFYQTALAQYSEEATKLFQMMSQATEATAKGAKSAHKRGYDDVPL